MLLSLSFTAQMKLIVTTVHSIKFQRNRLRLLSELNFKHCKEFTFSAKKIMWTINSIEIETETEIEPMPIKSIFQINFQH